MTTLNVNINAQLARTVAYTQKLKDKPINKVQLPLLGLLEVAVPW